MSSFVLDFQEIENAAFSRWWKRIEFRELSNIQGIQVPEGFCVTTVGYEQVIGKMERFKLY